MKDDKVSRGWEGKRRSSASEKESNSSDKVSQASGASTERKRSDESCHLSIKRNHSSQAHSQYQAAAGHKNNSFLKAEISMDDDTSAVSQTSSTSGKKLILV